MEKVIVDLQVNGLFTYREGDFTDHSLAFYREVELTTQIGPYPKGTKFSIASVCASGVLLMNGKEYTLTYKLA